MFLKKPENKIPGRAKGREGGNLQLTETEKEVMINAMDLVISRITAMEMNGEQYLSNITDAIDPERELSPDRRLKVLRDSVESIKMKTR